MVLKEPYAGSSNPCQGRALTFHKRTQLNETVENKNPQNNQKEITAQHPKTTHQKLKPLFF